MLDVQASTLKAGSMPTRIDPSESVAASFLGQSKLAEAQLTQLAEAMPQDKSEWRPDDGARSIAEVFLHAAWGNYLIMKTLGGQLPEGVDLHKLEKSTTDMKQIQDELKKSFEAANKYIASIPKSDYGTEVEFFGTRTTKLDMIFSAATHQWETLGQAIAYSRANHIVPPWTVARQF